MLFLLIVTENFSDNSFKYKAYANSKYFDSYRVAPNVRVLKHRFLKHRIRNNQLLALKD
jgi:hypothetical protein